MAKQHPFVHVELPVNDREAAERFYSEVFGWKVEQMPDMNYATFDDGKVGGGFAPITPEYPAGSILLHIGTDDIEASLLEVEAAGGKRVRACEEIPGIGWWAVFEDPFGNRLALFKPLEGQM